MKALVIAEHADVARELAGGARELGADEVSLVCFGGAVEGASDKVLNVAVPAGALVDDAAYALVDAANAADVVLVEATRRGKVIAGRLAAKLGTAAAGATVELTAEGGRGTYFGGVAERVQKSAGDKQVYIVAAGVCDASKAAGAGAAEDVAWVAPVRAGDDEITAEVVILAEGTNSMLSERCLGNARPKADQMAVGIKEVFELPANVIEDRFLLPEGEGAAMLFVGDCTKGSVGGGFLYTNKESISLGLVATISLAADGSRNEVPVYQMLEDFKNHPAVAPIIRGAKMVEHSGHMVPEGGYGMIPRYVFDGCLIAGETAGLCMNMGYQVRGMDFAVASGRMAAEAAVAAIDAGDTSAAGLASYKAAMEGSFVIQDLRTFSKWPHVMEEWGSMFTDYPVMVKEVFNAMFSVDGAPQRPLMKRMGPIIKKRGALKLGREVMKAVKAL